jgi:Zn-dependent M16 (insulinase) family peptidase
MHGYRVTAVQSIPERNIVAIRLIHERTGAEHLHLDSEDQNNTFCVTFKTVPRDSTGVAHILEHISLCGSEKYPVRDPFFNMIKRSLNTYMNAWTGPDFTSYPFSSQNREDYYNLLSVYLDAAFFPRLSEWDFMQEGHHLAFQPDTANSSGVANADSNAKLQIKGVVFNEMKGAMSDPTSYFSHRLSEAMFTKTTYHHNSGGDPDKIPDLSFEQLKKFREVHYHPSNAQFYTYGDLPFEEHLKFIDANVLSTFDRINPNTGVPDEERFTQAKRVEVGCAPQTLGADEEQQVRVSVSFLVNNITDPFETLSLSVLSSLLLQGPNSPMHQALIESNIGMDYAPSTGYEPHSREATFGIGLQGIAEADVDRVVELIEATLRDAARDGFSRERIEGLLHQIELGHKNIRTSVGLDVLSALTSSWLHGADPIARLQLNVMLERLKSEMQNDNFFPNLLRKYLIENKHKVILVMKPDLQWNAKQHESEAKRLAAIEQTLTPDKRAEIARATAELAARQSKPEDVSVLPCIRLEDIPRSKSYDRVVVKQVEGAPLYWVPQATNEIAYWRAIVSLESLPEELLEYVPLFATLFSKIGTSTRSHRQLAQQIELYTGGIRASTFTESKFDSIDYAQEGLQLFTMGFVRNSDQIFGLLHDILCNLDVKNVDRELLRSYIAQDFSATQDSLASSGHEYAMSRAQMSLSRHAYISESWHGLKQFFFLQKLVNLESLEEVVDALERVRQHALHRGMRSHLVADAKHEDSLTQRVGSLLRNLPEKPSSSAAAPSFVPRAERSFFVIPSAVNYVALAKRSVPFASPLSAPLKVLSRALSLEFLHKEIREKGGAYGSGASSGNMWTFYSYRDPNDDATLEAFAKSNAWINSEHANSEQMLRESKLGVFSDLDAPTAPSQRGTLLFRQGITPEMLQKRREAFFDATWSQLRDAYTHVQQQSLESVCIVGTEQSAAKYRERGWHVEE